MPNNVRNVLEFDHCSKERSVEIMEFVKEENLWYGTFDFNKVIPMPKSLDITNGSETEHGIEVYLTAVNPTTRDLGYAKMELHEYATLRKSIYNENIYMRYNDRLDDDIIRKYTKNSSVESLFEVGKVAADNMHQYGATTWYDWCINNWGSKWSSYDCMNVNPADGYMEFCTAWSGVPQVISKLSEIFPDVLFHYSCADEDDIGSIVGKIDFQAGEELGSEIPEQHTQRAYEMVCDILGCDMDELFPNDVEPEDVSNG